jgi:hypothetical protein
LRAVLIIFLCLLGFAVRGQHDLNYFRSAFHAAQTEESLDKIIRTIPEEEDESKLATIMAYKAVSETMKADYKISPFSKLQQFNSGRDKLEALLVRHPSTEIRYLRLLVQLNVPRIVNYSDNIIEDLNHISNALRAEKIQGEEKILFVNTLTTVLDNDEYLQIINNTLAN